MNSRRNFLKIAGVGLTGSLINPVNSAATKLSVGKKSVKIGVLLPQSNEHPLYPASFLNGLRLAVNTGEKYEDYKTEIITEQVNYGTPLVTKSKMQQLITENNVNLVVGLLNSEVSYDIGDTAKNVQIPTIIANAGETFLRKKIKENPWLFFNTLNLLENSFQAGKYAVEKFGKNICVVTGFYDCGYDALDAFYKGVELAGGCIVETCLEKQNDTNFILRAIKEIKKDKPDGIYVFLNGNLADDFFRSVQRENLKVPVIASSFAVEDSRLVNVGYAANNIYNFNTWNRNIDNEENRLFVSNYKKQYNNKPDQFGFLGYETGLLINDSLSKCNGDFSGANIADSISGCNIKSPAGNISVNKKSGMVSNTIYLCKIQPALFNQHENKIVSNYIPISEFDEVFASFDSNMRSGWLNPYLFV